MALGHEVRLLPAGQVKSFVLRDKTDAKDAHAIYVACQQSYIKSVPVKTEQQQAWLTLHTRRERYKATRTAYGNAVRGMMEIVRQLGGKTVGVGIAIEKGFQDGGKRLREEGVNLMSLAIVTGIEDGKILLAGDGSI